MLNLAIRNVLRNSSHLRSTTLQSPTFFSVKRTIIILKDHKYTAHATARGQGRNGEVKCDEEHGLSLRLALPKSMGGKGDGQNPEQLFAMGYAACFLGALQAAAAKAGKKDAIKDAAVHAEVHIGEPLAIGGFGLAVNIKVGGVGDEALIKAAHESCPYSRALKHGVVVNVSEA